ncbi:hypothetical protein [Arthrobacter sp. OAP107]|uniref:hypothetical protein n=1 Tax=Arthrobacter sp. OAP107 TaxID=3156445 RepID=UPI003393289A
MNTELRGDAARVLRATGVDENQDPQLRGVHHVLHLGNRAGHDPQQGIRGAHHRFNFPARRFRD